MCCSLELGRIPAQKTNKPTPRLSYEHFHKEETGIRLDFQSVFGTNIYLSAGRIHGLTETYTKYTDLC